MTASHAVDSLTNEIVPPDNRIAHRQDAHWWNHAACLFYGPALFFGPDGETRGERQRREREAKRICATCTVRERCRKFALTTRQPHGIWGGTSECDRVDDHRVVDS